MPDKGHTYLNKPAPESCRLVKVCGTFLLPPAIKGLKLLEWYISNALI